jgi:hypothetical protein
MMPAEKRQLVQETIDELERALKAIRSVQKAMVNESFMHNINPVIRGSAKRASMDATRALAKYRQMPIY